MVVVFQTFLQLSYEEAVGDRRGTLLVNRTTETSLGPLPAFGPPTLNSLSVPVVDLVDVPEDDFVFSFHVVGDAFLLDLLHEALQKVTGGQQVEDAPLIQLVMRN